MRPEREIYEAYERRKSRLRDGAWKQDHVEIEMLEWVLGIRDDPPEDYFSEDETIGEN